ncbi:hypothetical protein [Clostridium phage vB_CpeP_PMQ04]|nr:hypothetical protein [Clostridium phage vB_CpeP_PMQ04]
MNDGYYALLLAIIYDIDSHTAFSFVKGTRKDYEVLKNKRITERDYQVEFDLEGYYE